MSWRQSSKLQRRIWTRIWFWFWEEEGIDGGVCAVNVKSRGREADEWPSARWLSLSVGLISLCLFQTNPHFHMLLRLSFPKFLIKPLNLPRKTNKPVFLFCIFFSFFFSAEYSVSLAYTGRHFQSEYYSLNLLFFLFYELLFKFT